MNTYICTFNGRLITSIGAFYQITAIINADTEQAAIMRLYEKYDHITRLLITKKDQS